MRILNVVLDNHIGGPQNRVLSIGDVLRRCGIETIIVTAKGDGDFAARARKLNFQTYQINLFGPKHFNNAYSIISNFIWIVSFPIAVWELLIIIINENIDIVQVNGLINLQAPIAAAILRKKIIWYLSSSLFPKVIVFCIMPFVRAVSSHIVIISKILIRYYNLNEFDSNKLTLIPRSIDTDIFNPSCISESEKIILRRNLGIDKDDFIVGCIGNINPIKGYELFIHAAYKIKEKHSNVKFLIIGDSTKNQKDYLYKLKNLVSEKNLESDILFIGKRDDIPQLLALFDVFVLSSFSEGGPAVTLEAMAMEKAVVATNVGAVSEQIDNGITGIIIDSWDPELIASEVNSLLENAEIRIKIGTQARIRVKKYFSFKAYLKLHYDLYNEISKE